MILPVIVLSVVIILMILRPFNIEHFSLLNDNIAIGNPKSWSNRINPYLNMTETVPNNIMTYQSQGIPLPHEDHRTIPVTDTMAYFAQYNCKPECCLYSQDSCSHGCVCHTISSHGVLLQNNTIVPRS